MTDTSKLLKDARQYLKVCEITGNGESIAAELITALLARLDAAEADAKRWQAVLHAGGDLTLRLHNTRPDGRLAVIDAALSATQPAQAAQGEQEAELRRSLAAAEATISERNAEIIDLHKRLKAAQGAGEVVAWVVMNGLSKYQVCGAKAPADALCSEMQKRHDLSGSLAAFHVQPLYTRPAPGVPDALKDHQIAAMVNSLRDIARQFHGHDSLRERIANVLVPALKAEAKTDEMGPLFVKGALSGIVDAQVRDLWPTKSATHPAPVVPEGWKLVPVEPTEEMLDAVVTTMDEAVHGKNADVQYREDWAAMLAATPTPPAQAAQQGEM